MRTNHRKLIITVLVLLANLLLWTVPGNVPYLVAQQRDILLGRYSVERFTAILLLIPVTVLALYIIWSNKANRRKRQFQVMALSISVLASVVAMDFFLRLIEPGHYVNKGRFYHRQPNTKKNGTTHDVPEAAFRYPTTPPGYPDINFTLTVDKWGFRNKTELKKYDVVILGDSFTEGSGVSDDQVWPVLFAQKSNRTVYNLGISGGNPATYVETLKKFALPLSPKVIICMLYEGNDFRDSNFRKKTGPAYALRSYIRASPLRWVGYQIFVRYLASTAAGRPAAVVNANDEMVLDADSIKALSWLPVAVPDGPDAKYYAFKVKALLTHWVNKDSFLKSAGCRKTFVVLREIKKMCDQRNIVFIIAYAPDKPHILLPLIQHKVSPEQLYVFMALKEKNLPPRNELMDALSSRINICETATEEFCRAESIMFVSLSQPLQQAIAQGRQAYFTYDQHWTPVGHQIVADALYDCTNKLLPEKQN